MGTITKYLGYFVEAFLFFELGAFSVKYKEQVKSPKKIYTIDTGFIFSKGFRFTGNIGILYENLVAVELKRRELEGELDLYYYKNPQGYEIDFVVKKGIEITGLIQVSYRLDNEKTKSREIRSLLHGCKDLRCDHLMVITGDYENEESVEWFGLKGKVRFIPLWKWLLNPDFS